jgi:hypothetical protein
MEVWSASRPGRFAPEEIAPDTHWIGGWVGSRVRLDAVEKRKLLPCRESNPSRPARTYTDWANPIPSAASSYYFLFSLPSSSSKAAYYSVLIPSYIIYKISKLSLQITSRVALMPLLSWEATTQVSRSCSPLPAPQPSHSIVSLHNTIPPAMRSSGYCRDREVSPDS